MGSIKEIVKTSLEVTEKHQLRAADAKDGDAYGSSVALYNDILAVGTTDEDTAAGSNAGKVYI